MRGFIGRAMKRMEDAASAVLKKTPAVYDDTDVCRLVGLRKRVLVRDRRPDTRGTLWDAAGDHCGMTREWMAERNPRAPKAILDALEPLHKGDGVVTCQIVSNHLPNREAMLCAKVATGEKIVVRVRDSGEFCIGDQIDVVQEGGRYVYSAKLNPEDY